MKEGALRHCRILVVEDEYLLADELRSELEDAGAVVLGPVATVEQAMTLIAGEPHIDGAILDVNLGGVMIYPAADMLLERGTPFAFATGYDSSVIPSRFAHVLRCEKPINMGRLVQAVGFAPRAGSS
jgi:CheY-like chemotaxis protein